MRILWTLLKVMIGLAIAIPVCLFVLGLVGTVIGLAFIAARLALVGLAGYGLFRVARHFFRPSPATVPPAIRELPSVDHPTGLRLGFDKSVLVSS